MEPRPATADAAVAALLVRVGERVRTARKSRRYSRRELSERSGVSPRYLAQLEGGEGNISIGLLQRIGIALGQPIEALVAAEGATARGRKAERLCLIGLRGAGKSTLGARLGEALGVPFVELNEAIEREADMPVGEVIALYGEEHYRRLEADTLGHIVATRERVVLAVAGGVVEAPDTFAELVDRFHTVWLRAEPAEHMARVRAQGDLRPMAGNPRAMERLREILAERESRYRRAEHHLDTGGRTVEDSLADLRGLVASHDIFPCRASGGAAPEPRRGAER